jgi:hypothetical protein
MAGLEVLGHYFGSTGSCFTLCSSQRNKGNGLLITFDAVLGPNLKIILLHGEMSFEKTPWETRPFT